MGLLTGGSRYLFGKKLFNWRKWKPSFEGSTPNWRKPVDSPAERYKMNQNRDKASKNQIHFAERFSLHALRARRQGYERLNDDDQPGPKKNRFWGWFKDHFSPYTLRAKHQVPLRAPLQSLREEDL